MNQAGEDAKLKTPSEALWKEFIAHVEDLRRKWLRGNHIDSKDVFEVMRPEEQKSVYGKIRQWELYITPIAEAWWSEREFSVVWPSDNSKPMQVYKTEAA